MSYKAFKEWLGDAVAQELKEASFEKLAPENQYVSYSYRAGVLLTNPYGDAEVRERVIQHYLKFFEEILGKLQVQALELVPNITIAPDLSEKVLDTMRMFFNKVLGGHESYLPYLGTIDPETAEELSKGVDVALYLSLTKEDTVNGQTFPPKLYWFVNTEFWALDPDNPGHMGKVSDIETRSAASV